MAATLAAQRTADREALDRQLAHVEDQADAVTRAADLQQENCQLQQRVAVLEAELKGGGGVTKLQVLHTLPSKLTHCCCVTQGGFVQTNEQTRGAFHNRSEHLLPICPIRPKPIGGSVTD